MEKTQFREGVVPRIISVALGKAKMTKKASKKEKNGVEKNEKRCS